ncbi:hypothetical protein ACJIZ3_007605 [Penstemon smallii]|uniref:Peptidase A1 domain-containing protein n=1 Tax=Penstemon smallii TaxID=265156 RepID=A0ABD3T7F8_9LAMI
MANESEIVTNLLQRSFSRARSFGQDYYSLQSASSEIIPDRGEYLLKFYLGAPPIETLAIADTGSDLTWIQCKPCVCFDQKAPIFEPSRSSTYKQASCSSKVCTSLPRTSCNVSSNTCNYKVQYGDNSFSKGDIAMEKITLGSTAEEKVTLPSVVIGCGHLNQGTFGAGASGIVGLGGGEASLITQMGSSIQGKFSYCLVPYLGRMTKSSKMKFGDQAVVTGAGVATTPIVPNRPKTFYFLTLEGITVGNMKLNYYDTTFPSSSVNVSKAIQEGNIIIDSGTTLTYLSTELYYQVITALKSQMKSRPIRDPLGLLKLCFRSIARVNVPEITFHFKGADVKLKPINTFIETTRRSICLAFAPASIVSIFGNLAQANFLVGYDLEKKTVSFKPTDCSRS